jgi:hypothetical protein
MHVYHHINDQKKSIFDLVLHCICMTVVRVQRFSKIFRQSDPTKYLNTTNICRKWFRIVRHNELYLFNYLLCRSYYMYICYYVLNSKGVAED